MEKQYNVYFFGQVRSGHDPAAVRQRLAGLFKADEATLDKLFSGKRQLIKRNCDQATATRYRQAMEQAGAIAVVKDAASATAEKATAPARKPSAAERIAALAAAPDVGAPGGTSARAEAAPAPAGPVREGAIGLLPEGTEVLRPEERAGPVAGSVSVPELDVAASGERLSAEPPPPPPAPDTSHLSTAPGGEALPNLPSSSAPVAPDTSALDLSPAGTDFSDCAAPQPAPPELDLSGIDLAPPGSEVLEQQYRQREDRPPPDTDHLALDD